MTFPFFSPTYKLPVKKGADEAKNGENKKSSKPLSFRFLTATNVRTAYNVAGIKPINGVSINGAGQTIVVVLACNGDTAATLQNDANINNTDNGLPLFNSSNFTVINQAGGAPSVTGSGCNTGWSLETSLDIQSSHTMAPNANMVVILADNDGGQLYAAINYAVQNYPGAVISNSWGANEGPSQVTAIDAALQQAAAQGQSVSFSTGDSGDAALAGVPRVQFPASNTYAIAVGGTTLVTGTNVAYLFEAAWGNYNISTTPFVFFSGAGGGISKFYSALPAQSAAISSFIAGGYGVVGSTNCNGTTCRALPDIAMDGDSFTPFKLYNSAGCKGYCYSGGTSLSAPLFTGVLALVNQARMLTANNQLNPIGLITPYLYTQIDTLKRKHALNVINPPHFFPSGTGVMPGYPNAFIQDKYSFNMDTSLTNPENQFWGDVSGVGSPNVPNFVQLFSTI